MVRDSVEIAEDVAADERSKISIRYYSVTYGREETIISCEGDLIVICNVLVDYADMLDEFLQADRERLGLCGALHYFMTGKAAGTISITRMRTVTAGIMEESTVGRSLNFV